MRTIPFLLLFFWFAVHMSLALPAFEGPDEVWHFGYIADLRQKNSLPNPSRFADFYAGHESAQPPLYYLAVAGWSVLGPAHQWEGERLPNPWPPGPTQNDNRNLHLYGDTHIPQQPAIEAALHWMRFMSVFMGMLAVAVAFRAARDLFAGGRVIFVGVLFAFNPTLIHTFAVLGNDAAALLFGAVAVWGLLRLPRQSLFFGLMLGLGGLSKAGNLLFIGLASVMIVLRMWRQPSGIIIMRTGLLFFGVALLVCGPWYLYGALRFGDPLGTAPHLAMPWAFDPPRPLGEALLAELPTLPTVWASFGSSPAGVFAPAWSYFVPLLLLMVVVLGKHRLRPLQGAILLLTCAGMFAAYGRWAMTFTAVGGRLVLPGWLAFAVLVGAGLPRRLLPMSAALVIFAAMVAGWLTVPAAYGVFFGHRIGGLQGGPLRYDDIEFIGYRIEQARLNPANQPPLDVTLCWRSLREDDPLPVTNPFTFALLDGEVVFGGRESLFGMGSYTLWRPGRAFCDRFAMPFEQPPQPATAYRVTVGVFDVARDAPLPTSDGGSPLVGWIAASGPPLPEPTSVEAAFERDLLLLSAEITETSDTLSITTAWGTREWAARPLSQFVHLLDSDTTIVGQSDTPLGGNRYPSFLWGQNERTYTQMVQIDVAELPRGQYCAQMGLYDPSTGVRAPTQTPDNVVQLGCIVR